MANGAYEKYLANTKAAAVIVTADKSEKCNTSVLISNNPYLSYAKISGLFSPQHERNFSGIHPSASVAKTAELGNGVCIGPSAVIEDGVILDDNVYICAGSFIGRNSVIGKNTLIKPNAVVSYDVTIGDNCTIRSGAVIGDDGFGFAQEDRKWIKIHQLGGVIIGNNVDIGANTCIDRGALDNTIIGNNVILDNQIQIAHNVIIGNGTAMAGCCGVAGSTKIGNHCAIGGATCIAGHIEIASYIQISAFAFITKSLTDPSIVYSPAGLGCMDVTAWRKNIVRFRQLNKMAERLTLLEKINPNI